MTHAVPVRAEAGLKAALAAGAAEPLTSGLICHAASQDAAHDFCHAALIFARTGEQIAAPACLARGDLRWDAQRTARPR